jgi:hypothetical protein
LSSRFPPHTSRLVIPHLDGQGRVVSGEIIEQEQAGAGLVHIADPAHVPRGDLVHSARPLGQRRCEGLPGGSGAYLASRLRRAGLGQHGHVEPRSRERRGPVLDIAPGRREHDSVVHRDPLHRIKPGQLTSLPLQHPEQLLLVPAATEHRSRTVRGLHLRSQVEISQRGRVDEMDLGIPRILVDQLNRHDDPLTCAPGHTGAAGLGSRAASTIAPVRGPGRPPARGMRKRCPAAWPIAAAYVGSWR